MGPSQQQPVVLALAVACSGVCQQIWYMLVVHIAAFGAEISYQEELKHHQSNFSMRACIILFQLLSVLCRSAFCVRLHIRAFAASLVAF